MKRSGGRFRWVGRLLLGLGLAALLVVRADTVNLTAGRAVAAAHLFSLASWEVTNFPSKWLHLLSEALPGRRPSREERLALVDEYLQLSRFAEKEKDRLEGRFLRPGAMSAPEGGKEKGEQSHEYLDDLLRSKQKLRPGAEEAVEAELSSVLIEEGLGSRFGLLFPPVDLRFGEPPTMLVTSLRDRIQRWETLLLTPDMEVLERDRLETEIEQHYDLSALIVDLGGLSTYPTMVSELDQLRGVLQTAAHEWLHAYFFFHALGRHYWITEDMFTLNETAADLAGRELGDATFALMGGDLSISPSRFLPAEERNPRITREMRETRTRVEELLAEGKVDEAEQYMKERWWFLALRGYRLRKLNQAFFAFYGLYAQGAGSTSPIGDQLKELRSLVPSVGSFVRTVSGVSSYEEFLELLERLRSQNRARQS